MTTLLLIGLALVLVLLIVCVINAALNGCPFGWMAVCCGGLGELVGVLFDVVAEVLNGK